MQGLGQLDDEAADQSAESFDSSMLVQQEQALYSLASTKLMNSEPNGNMKMARAGPIAANGRKKNFD